jgi:hypothetical protein
VTGIAVLNGAGVAGLAAQYEVELLGAGFIVEGTGNDVRFDRERTIITYLRDDKEAEPVAFLLAERFPSALVEAVDTPPLLDGEPVAIAVILGRDLTTPVVPPPNPAGGREPHPHPGARARRRRVDGPRQLVPRRRLRLARRSH